MRLLALFAVAAAITGTAHAAPDGFTRAAVLEPVVQYVSGKTGDVLCAKTIAVWDAEKATHQLDGAFVWGFTDLPSETVYIHPNGCRVLRAEIKGNKLVAPLTLKAGFVVTLVHESMHVKGIINEGVAECDAMHLAPRVMVKFFHVKPGKQLRAYMAAAWEVHDTAPPEYQTVC